MREIKFKAKRKDNGEWVYGYYVKIHNDKDNQILHRIYTGFAEKEVDELFEDFYEVIPETICQYTGLKDKDGVEIYEKDICEGNDYSDKNDLFVIKYGKYKTEDWKIKVGEIKVCQFGWYAEFIKDKVQVHLVSPNGIKVIGNVCDKESINADTTN